MAFTEPLAAFFDTMHGFAVRAVFTDTSASASYLVDGIFDNDYVEVTNTETSGPAFHCQSAKVPNVAHGDTLLIDATTYTVRGVQADGTGVTVLILEAP